MKPFKRPSRVARCRPLYGKKNYKLIDKEKKDRIYILRVAYTGKEKESL